MFYLSIAAIVQNEGLYIADWIHYHEKLGVEHFYIYENDSTDNTWEVLQNFPKWLVTAVKVPGPQMQLPTMNRFIKEHRYDTHFAAMIDCDEYLVPTIKNSIPEVLKDYNMPDIASLGVHWKLFGSSGEAEYKAIPVVERFTHCAKEFDRHIKSIIRPAVTIMHVTVHKYRHATGRVVDEHFRIIPELESRPEPATGDIIYIAHYVVKSYAECKERRNRPRADIAAKHDFEQFWPAHDRNEVEDLRALTLWRTICGKQ